MHVVVSSSSSRRIARARAWLEAREPAEEILIIGATLDAANEVARGVAQTKGAAFGWHRLSLTQLAATLAGPTLAARGIVPLSRLGMQAMAARLVHALAADGALGRYTGVAQGPGFARAVASVMMELRLAKVDPDRLGIVAPDLATLVRTYESNLTGGGLTDWAGVMISAAEAAMSGDFVSDQAAPATSDIHSVRVADAAPVIDGQLRAPWRWERLLVEAAVIGGRQRWRAGCAAYAARMNTATC